MGTCVEEKNQEGKNGKKKKKFRVRLNSFQSTKILINFKTKCPFGLQWFWRLRFSSTFFSLFIFFLAYNSWLCQLWTVHPCIVHNKIRGGVHTSGSHLLFTDPQISLFSNFFIKNGSHGTIHTFKNYFTTVFSVSAK